MRMLVVASIATLALSSAAFAHEPGDIILRAGVAHAAPDDSSSRIKADGAKLPGTKATVGNNTQLGLTGTYIVAPHFGIELLAATPFTHSVKVKGLNALLGPGFDGRFADVTHLPPTLSAQYFFLDTKSKFQPYAGIGLNYTMFFDEKLSSRAKGNGFRKLKLEDSWGLALQLGADYQITDKLFLNAAVWKIDMKTTAKANLQGVGKVKVDVDVDPWVYFVGLGYKF
ncbi:outer membrane protein W [Betaproteobacteria bacterium]|nr:outer membrane protein W [Betaproteobacteria bacterium]